MNPPVALTIAGSDSGGGAGLQADLRAFGRFGAFGTSVVTAVTAQNTVGVHDVHVIPTATVEAQLEAVLDDFAVAAVKTGMLATAELIELVASYAAEARLPNLVVDPVLVSATGHRLMEADAIGRYRELLLPHATVVTPNLIEAGVLLGRELHDLADATEAAAALADDGSRVVVVKGGHLSGPEAIDVVVMDGEVRHLRAARIDTEHTHGTGCTFSAACAGAMAGGAEVFAALQLAKDYVTAGIAGARHWALGAGHGPLDHLGFTP